LSEPVELWYTFFKDIFGSCGSKKAMGEGERRSMEDMVKESVSLDTFMAMDFDERANPELIGGVVYSMAPTSPRWEHQKSAAFLSFVFGLFFNGKSCEFMPYPIDVLLGENYVLPDMFVLCDRRKILEDGRCHGAPDLVVEILSRSTSLRDRSVKLELYRQFGVKEYWMVNSMKKGEVSVEVVDFYLDDAYEYFSAGDIAKSVLFEGLEADIDKMTKYVWAV
jgi:Uma2 family endonuclease